MPRVLKGYDFNDLDMESVAVYRNRFAAVRPGHVWSDLPVPEFLERIGAIGKNRDEGFAGLRLAGLLMFGRAEVIRDALPHYMVDHQERPGPKAERRWIDRLVPDGSWSGNVYDFFRKVYAQEPYLRDSRIPKAFDWASLFLHDIGELVGEPAVERSDALIAEPAERVDHVLANPPFGKKSSTTITNAEGEDDREALTYERQDFWETTSNKQLNFLQHIVSPSTATSAARPGGSGSFILQQEIIDHLEAALAAFRDVAAALPASRS